jgi:hypothetical protein
MIRLFSLGQKDQSDGKIYDAEVPSLAVEVLILSLLANWSQRETAARAGGSCLPSASWIQLLK